MEHEQYDPETLLQRAVLAEKHGFERIISSDHFHPWAHTNASGGFAWVWLAAAAERTESVRIGTEVTAPILRYNPAIVAQAFATLGFMYPGRVFLGVGLGEAMNEVPVGYDWPSVEKRVERLEEAIRVIRMLWTDDFVSFTGKFYRLKKARLYTKAKSPVPLFVATSGPKVAEIAGKYADGLLTTPLAEGDDRHYREKLFPALERGARLAGRDPSSIVKAIEVPVSYHEDFEKALESCRFWAATTLPAMLRYEIYDPREIEEHGKMVDLRKLAKIWIISNDIEEHIRRAREYIKLGFSIIYFQSSSPDEEKFIETYGKKVLPHLKTSSA